jgi:hypothetical protein
MGWYHLSTESTMLVDIRNKRARVVYGRASHLGQVVAGRERPVSGAGQATDVGPKRSQAVTIFDITGGWRRSLMDQAWRCNPQHDNRWLSIWIYIECVGRIIRDAAIGWAELDTRRQELLRGDHYGTSWLDQQSGALGNGARSQRSVGESLANSRLRDADEPSRRRARHGPGSASHDFIEAGKVGLNFEL